MKYNVRIPIDGWIDVIVETDDPDSVEDLAMDRFNRGDLEIDNFGELEVRELDYQTKLVPFHLKLSKETGVIEVPESFDDDETRVAIGNRLLLYVDYMIQNGKETE